MFLDSYNVEVPRKIMQDVLSWRKNIYQAVEALDEFKQKESRQAALDELDRLAKEGKFPDIPTEKVADRAFKVISWELEHLPK